MDKSVSVAPCFPTCTSRPRMVIKLSWSGAVGAATRHTLLRTYGFGPSEDIAGCVEAVPIRTGSSGSAARDLTTSCRSPAGAIETPECMISPVGFGTTNSTN